MTNQNNEKSKNGKRIALILLALLLIAAIAFGAYTYSKYVSSGNGSGSATVAQWGFTVTMENKDNAGFSTKYGSNGKANAAGTAIVANVDTEGNVVAPGANGSLTFTVGGKAEVLAKISATVTASSDVSLTLTKSGSSSVTYYPIKYTLNDGTADVKTGTMTDIKTYLESDSFTQTIQAGTPLPSKTYTLSWKWIFEGENLTVGESTTVDCDELDTILGQIASNSESPETYTISDSNGDPWTITASEAVTTVKFSIKIAITQALS